MKKIILIIGGIIIVFLLVYLLVPYFIPEQPIVVQPEQNNNQNSEVIEEVTEQKDEPNIQNQKNSTSTGITMQSISPNDLVGDWEVENSFYEFITLELDGTYSTYLNDRLLISGSWEFSDLGVLTLLPDIDAVPGEVYQSVVLNNDTLSLNSGEVVWRKV